MATLIDFYPILSYALAAVIPLVVLLGLDYRRNRWVTGCVFAHLALVNLFNRALWPALRPEPSEYPPGSRAHLDETLAYIHTNLAYSIVASLALILALCLAWRWRLTQLREDG